MGFRPPVNRLANASLTIATGGVPGVSALVKSRPASIGVPYVLNQPGLTRLKYVRRSEAGIGGPSGNSIRLFHLVLLSGVTSDSAALDTPGTATAASINCRNSSG